MLSPNDDKSVSRIFGKFSNGLHATNENYFYRRENNIILQS